MLSLEELGRGVSQPPTLVIYSLRRFLSADHLYLYLSLSLSITICLS